MWVVKGEMGIACEQTYFTLIFALYVTTNADGGDNSLGGCFAPSCGVEGLVFLLLVV